MSQPRPTIVLKLAREMQGLLQTELSRRHYHENRFTLAVLTILSRPRFRQELLFRDYGASQDDLWLSPVGSGTEVASRDPDDASEESDPLADDRASSAEDGARRSPRIFKPALIYLTLALMRRLTLANNLKERPTNMHLLLQAWAAHGPRAQGWAEVSVARALQPPGPSAALDCFARVAQTLPRQVRVLGDSYGPISAARRAAYGPFWLQLRDCAAEMAEELTLWDCLASAPIPIDRDLDEESFKRLNRVLEALNERYGLLRSCGLDPEQWYDAELSIGDLDELRALRRDAETRLNVPEAAGGPTRENAYAQTFKDRRTRVASVAGFGSFEDFACSEVGQQMIHGRPLSLNAPLAGQEDEDLDLGQALPDPWTDADGSAPEQWADRRTILSQFIAECPGIRKDPVLSWVAQATLVDGRPIHGDDGVLADPELRRLLADSARYSATDDEALAARLERDLTEAARYCASRLSRTRPVDGDLDHD